MGFYIYLLQIETKMHYKIKVHNTTNNTNLFISLFKIV